nr:ACT domain protein [uncultured bacterium]
MENAISVMKYLLISLVGSDQADIINNLCQLAAKHHCNILESRIHALGAELCINMLLSGSWSALAKMEASMTSFANRYELQAIVRRTDPRSYPTFYLPYSVYIVTLDSPGIITKITDFFAKEKIPIFALHSTTNLTKYTATPMLTVNMTIHIPADLSISELRDRFMLFCDSQNFDAVMEPEKE